MESLDRHACRIAHAGGHINRPLYTARSQNPGLDLLGNEESVIILNQAVLYIGFDRRRNDSRGQNDHVNRLTYSTAAEDVLGLDRQVRPRGFFYLRDFALDEMEFLVVLRCNEEVLQPSGCANVDVEDVDVSFRILLANVAGLLERTHATDTGTVLEVVVVA